MGGDAQHYRHGEHVARRLIVPGRGRVNPIALHSWNQGDSLDKGEEGRYFGGVPLLVFLCYDLPMANDEKFQSVTLVKSDEVRVAETPATLVSLKWDGFVEKPATKQAPAKPAVKTESK